MILCIQFLRVITLPPFLCTVGIEGIAILLGEVAIVVLRGFQPGPCMAGVHADAHLEVGLATGIVPLLQQVALRAHIHRVPLLIWRVPQIEVVVMVTQCHEVACAHTLVQVDQSFGVPVLCLPIVAQLLESKYGRIAKVFPVPVLLPRPHIIHESGIPVASLSVTLRSPVSPNTKFGIHKPLGTFPLIERAPLGFIVTRHHLHVGLLRIACDTGCCQHC